MSKDEDYKIDWYFSSKQLPPANGSYFLAGDAAYNPIGIMQAIGTTSGVMYSWVDKELDDNYPNPETPYCWTPFTVEFPRSLLTQITATRYAMLYDKPLRVRYPDMCNKHKHDPCFKMASTEPKTLEEATESFMDCCRRMIDEVLNKPSGGLSNG